MSEEVNISVNAKITNDPSISFPVLKSVEAYSKLNTPQCYIGKGSLKALSGSNLLKTLKFKNKLGNGEDVTIQILVGRFPPT